MVITFEPYEHAILMIQGACTRTIRKNGKFKFENKNRDQIKSGFAKGPGEHEDKIFSISQSQRKKAI